MDRPWTTLTGPIPDREYVALVTYLPLKRFRAIPKFLRASGDIARQLAGTRGLLGFSFRARILAREFYTVSAWEDEAALDAFVRAEPHHRTMRAMRSHMRETKFVRWRLRGSQVPPSWGEAMRVLRSA